LKRIPAVGRLGILERSTPPGGILALFPGCVSFTCRAGTSSSGTRWAGAVGPRAAREKTIGGQGHAPRQIVAEVAGRATVSWRSPGPLSTELFRLSKCGAAWLGRETRKRGTPWLPRKFGCSPVFSARQSFRGGIWSSPVVCACYADFIGLFLPRGRPISRLFPLRGVFPCVQPLCLARRSTATRPSRPLPPLALSGFVPPRLPMALFAKSTSAARASLLFPCMLRHNLEA